MRKTKGMADLKNGEPLDHRSPGRGGRNRYITGDQLIYNTDSDRWISMMRKRKESEKKQPKRY